MTQEFHISLTPVGNDSYLVRTERVTQGVPLAEEQISFPVKDWLVQARRLMSDPLLGLLQGNGDSNGVPLGGTVSPVQGQVLPKDLREFGQYLYSTLFQKTLRDSWVMAQGIAQNRGEVLRLRLGLKGLDLPRLPWEVMHSVEVSVSKLGQPYTGSSVSRPLAAGTDIIFSRYQADMGLRAGALLPTLLQPGQPLRLLMAIATPSDQVRLNLQQEARQLQQELAAHHRASMNGTGSHAEIELVILEQPGREQLTQALEQGHFQVFHYAGHSNLSEVGGSLYLVNERTGLTETLSGEDLAGLLVNNGIQMAVFNSCQGTYTATDTAHQKGRNLAEALVSRGIPAVLAMAENIPDQVALNLSRLFYRNLKQGYPIDLSLSRARQGLISSYGSEQLYWALPVLYLSQTFDGYLTAGDRSVDNPADRLLLSSPTTQAAANRLATDLKPTSGNRLTASEVDPELDMISNAVLADDDLGDLVEDYINPNTLGLDDELSYEENESELASLIQQLSRSQPEIEPLIAADNNENLLPDTDDLILSLYEELPEDPRYRKPADIGQLAPANRSSLTRLSDDEMGSSLAVSTHGDGSIHTLNTNPYGQARIREDSPKPPRRQWRKGSPAVVAALVSAGITAIALSVLLIPGLRFWQAGSGDGRPTTDVSQSPGTPANLNDLNTVQDFQKADTGVLTQFAVLQFSRNELAKGEQAVTELLNRGALQEAQTVLLGVPSAQLDKAPISFLYGRLGWEFIKRQNPDYGLSDVRRYWASAVKADPQSIDYQTALGFAYYAAGETQLALETWCTAVGLAAGDGATSAPIANEIGTIQCPLAAQLPNPAIANAYAGISIALAQLALDNPTYLPLAGNIQQVVLSSQATRFAPQALSTSRDAGDWIWTESTIGQWRVLMEVTQ